MYASWTDSTHLFLVRIILINNRVLLIQSSIFRSIEPSFLIIGVQDLITALWSYSYLKAYDEEQAKLKK